MENQDDLTISRDTMKGEGRFTITNFFQCNEQPRALARQINSLNVSKSRSLNN